MTTPNQPSSGLPLRALAMVLIALAIAFAGIGALNLFNSAKSDSSSTAEATSAAASTSGTAAASDSESSSAPAPAPSSAAPSPTEKAAAPAPATVDKNAHLVQVYNNTAVQGMASRAKAKVESFGWGVSAVGNFIDVPISKNTVFYGSDPAEKAAAEALAADLNAAAEPRLDAMSGLPAGLIFVTRSE